MKRLIKGCLLVLPMLAIVGCGGNKLSDAYNQEEVETRIETIISNINSQNYDAVVEMENAEMKEGLSAEKLAEVFDPINEQIGEIKSELEFKFKEDTENLVVVAIAEYENAKLQYTISLETDDLEISGLYVK